MRTAIQNRPKNSAKSSKTISKNFGEKIFRQDFRDLHKDFPNRGGSKSSPHQAVEPRSLYTVLVRRPVDPRAPLRDSRGLLTLTCAILKTKLDFIYFSLKYPTFSAEFDQCGHKAGRADTAGRRDVDRDLCTQFWSGVRWTPGHRFAIPAGS